MAKQGKRKVFLAFLDLRKSFDRVDRGILWKRLEQLGFNNIIIRLFKNLYDGMRKKCVINNITETGCVESKMGVRQGCVLSPTLF